MTDRDLIVVRVPGKSSRGWCRIGLPPFVEKVEGGAQATPAKEET
jgi:hypothetical protein